MVLIRLFLETLAVVGGLVSLSLIIGVALMLRASAVGMSALTELE